MLLCSYTIKLISITNHFVVIYLGSNLRLVIKPLLFDSSRMHTYEVKLAVCVCDTEECLAVPLTRMGVRVALLGVWRQAGYTVDKPETTLPVEAHIT